MFGPVAVQLMAAAIMISTFGCNNGLILSGARVYYAMAKDKLFFRKAGELDPVHHAPRFSLVTQCVWAVLLTLSGSYSDLLDYVIFAVLLFYMLTIAGLFVLRRTRPDLERPYKAFGYPVLPAAYIVVAGAIDVLLLVYKPGYAWPGLIIVLLGVPVYFIWRRPAGTRGPGMPGPYGTVVGARHASPASRITGERGRRTQTDALPRFANAQIEDAHQRQRRHREERPRDARHLRPGEHPEQHQERVKLHSTAHQKRRKEVVLTHAEGHQEYDRGDTCDPDITATSTIVRLAASGPNVGMTSSRAARRASRIP